MINRRDFLKGMLALGATACCNAAFGPLGSKYAWGQSAGGNGNTLILFNQFGGCDPLNSFAIPYTVGDYYSKRPSISIPQNMVLPLAGGEVGLHPALTTMKRLFDSGDCAIIRGIGDPVGTRSHFTSQDIFSRGITDGENGDGRGWLGRLGDLYFSNQQFNTIGIGVGSQLDFNSNRDRNIPLVLHSLRNFRYNNAQIKGLSWNTENDFRRETLAKLTTVPSLGNTRIEDKVENAQVLTQGAVNVIQNAFENFTPQGAYSEDNPGHFFSEVATTMNGNLGTKIFYGGLGGWDHHSDQGGIEGSQAALLAMIDSGIAAFEVDARAQGWWDKVTICIFTEFGRKTFENGSGGTDHGWGSSMVLIGGGVNGGVKGPVTTSADFQADWLPQHIDFRNPFSEMVRWLGFDPNPVFPESYIKNNLSLFS